MKIELCNFSGFKIYPGKGKLFIRSDSKVFRFINGKCESYFQQRLKPAKLDWTVVFRRLHKKGVTEQVQKKKARRVVKVQRAVVGASLDQIKQKKSESAVLRQEQRQKALQKAKAEKKEAQAKKKAEKVKTQQGKPQQQKISKQQAKGAGSKVKATSR